MKKVRFLLIPLLLFFLVAAGCAGTIKDVTTSYSETMQAFIDSAEEQQHFWLFGSNIIQVNLEGIPDAKWIVERLKKIDVFFLNEDGSINQDVKLDHIQLGQMIGTQIRLSGPVLDAFIRFYAPQIASNAAVIAIITLLGAL